MTSLADVRTAPGRSLGAAAALVALGALYAHVARDLINVWIEIPYYSYGVLVPLFSAFLIWEARSVFRGARFAWSGPGVALVMGAALLFAMGHALRSLFVETLSLPVLLGGLALLTLGHERSRAIAFPVAFLIFMAPLPAAALTHLSLGSQQLVAWFADHALETLGIAVSREGLFLHLRPATVEITAACDGLRFLLAMAVVGVAVAWSSQRRLPARAAVVALAVGVAIAANLIRVTATAVLVDRYGADAATGFAHVVFGKVVYAAMLAPFLVGVLALRARPSKGAGPLRGPCSAVKRPPPSLPPEPMRRRSRRSNRGYSD